MAIGGVSSATLRFRRPRGVKGPVADTFHKIGQLDVKTRQLNRVLNTIDSSFSIMQNIHQKMAVQAEGGGPGGFSGLKKMGLEGAGEAFAEAKGGLGQILQGDFDGWERLSKTLNKVRSSVEQLTEGEGLTRLKMLTELKNRKMLEISSPQLSSEFREMGMEVDKSIKGIETLKKKMDEAPDMADKASLLKGTGPELRKDLDRLQTFNKRLSSMKNDEFVLGKRADRYFTDFNPSMHETSSELRKLSRELDQVGITGGKSANEIADNFDKIDMDKAVKLVRALGKRIEDVTEHSSDMEKKIRRDQDRIDPSLQKTENNIDDIGDSLNEATNDSNKFTKSLGKASKAFDGHPVADGIGDKGRGMGGLSPMAAMSSMYASVIPYFAGQTVVGFSQQMGTIRSETHGSRINQDELRDSILSVAGTSRFTASDVATAVIGATRSGFKIDTDLKGIKDLTSLAVAESVDLQKAYASVEPVLNTLGIKLDDLMPVADKLSAATSTGATNLAELGRISGRSLSSHMETGGDFEEFLAIASSLRSVGKGEEVTSTALSYLQPSFARFSRGEGTKTQKAMLSKLGLDQSSFIDKDGNLKSTVSILKIINESIKETGENSQNVSEKLFDREVGRTITPLLSDAGMARIDKALEKISASGGSVAVKRKEQEGSVYSQIQNIMSAGQEITIRMFGGEKHLAELLSRIVTKLRDFAAFLKTNESHINAFFDRMTGWFDSNNEKIISFFRTIGKASLDIAKVFGKILSFIAGFLLHFQGFAALWLKLFFYVKMAKFLFGGFFGFMIKWLRNIFLGFNLISITSSVWTKRLQTFAPYLLTANKRMRKFLKYAIDITVQGELLTKGFSGLTNFIPNFITDKGSFTGGIKKVFSFLKNSIHNLFGIMLLNFKRLFQHLGLDKLFKKAFDVIIPTNFFQKNVFKGENGIYNTYRKYNSSFFRNVC